MYFQKTYVYVQNFKERKHKENASSLKFFLLKVLVATFVGAFFYILAMNYVTRLISLLILF